MTNQNLKILYLFLGLSLSQFAFSGDNDNNRADSNVSAKKVTTRGIKIHSSISDKKFFIAWALAKLPIRNLSRSLYHLIVCEMLTNWKNPVSVKVLKGHTDSVACIVMSPEGNLITSSYDKTIRHWDIDKELCVRVLHPNMDMISILNYPRRKFPEKTSHVCLFSRDELEKFFGIKSDLLENEENKEYLTCLTKPSSNNRFIIAGYTKGKIRIWEPGL